MKRQVAVFFVAGAGLLGGCAGELDSAPPEHDGLLGQDSVEIEGRQDALWTEGCDEQQQGVIGGATFYAYFALQFALQSYSTGSDRANHFFGVGYNDLAVQYRFLDMWGVMNDQQLTIVCAPQTGPICTRPDGKIIWASVSPDDIDNGVSRISVCDPFFDNVPEDEEVFWASQPGLLLHEIAHLAGARSDIAMGYHAVRSLAQWAATSTHDNADTFRYYIYNRTYN